MQRRDHGTRPNVVRGDLSRPGVSHLPGHLGQAPPPGSGWGERPSRSLSPPRTGGRTDCRRSYGCSPQRAGRSCSTSMQRADPEQRRLRCRVPRNRPVHLAGPRAGHWGQAREVRVVIRWQQSYQGAEVPVHNPVDRLRSGAHNRRWRAQRQAVRAAPVGIAMAKGTFEPRVSFSCCRAATTQSWTPGSPSKGPRCDDPATETEARSASDLGLQWSAVLGGTRPGDRRANSSS